MHPFAKLTESYESFFRPRKTRKARKMAAKERVRNNLVKLLIAGVQASPASASEACTPVANKRHKLLLVPNFSCIGGASHPIYRTVKFCKGARRIPYLALPVRKQNLHSAFRSLFTLPSCPRSTLVFMHKSIQDRYFYMLTVTPGAARLNCIPTQRVGTRA